ncbi:MAG TPA: hypothetical protein VLE96_07345 [Chlamydiales bacterium]|nr:hypothetical protein [Chlamydiales bacterium]
MITLACRPSDSLVWEIPKNGPLFIRFDLGLEDPFFMIDDEMHFEALSLALKKFRDEIWPDFQARIEGAVLYQGTADFAARFLWSEKQLSNWKQWIDGREETLHLKRLFCADAFAHYFQMLSHSLPDELSIYLFFDGTDIGTVAERHQLLSRTRFEHFQMVTKGLPFSNGRIWSENDTIQLTENIPHALCLPDDCPPDVLQMKMDQMPESYRVISEAFLTEDWEGVDTLHVIQDFLSEQGKRKLKGFEATGGQIVY